MRAILISAAIILLSQGCRSKVEIPIRYAGVVKNHDQVDTLVLKPGEHPVNFGSEVIIYDVGSVSFDTDVDFLFADTTAGKLKLAIEFKPIVDSLSAFYRKYQSEYVSPIVEQGTHNVVRTLLFKYRPTELRRNEFELEIVKVITENHPIRNYVDISKVDIVELRF